MVWRCIGTGLMGLLLVANGIVGVWCILALRGATSAPGGLGSAKRGRLLLSLLAEQSLADVALLCWVFLTMGPASPLARGLVVAVIVFVGLGALWDSWFALLAPAKACRKWEALEPKARRQRILGLQVVVGLAVAMDLVVAALLLFAVLAGLALAGL